MRMLCAAAVLAAASASPAFAQDAAPVNFQGGHVEAYAGLDIVTAAGDGASGVMYGIAGGYDFRSGNGVFGIEAEAAESTTDECGSFAGVGICAEAGRDLYIGGRAGGVVAEQVLIYAKAGYTNARLSLEAAGTSAGTNLDGIRGGVGVEWQPDSPFAVRLEYRYSNYQDDFSRHQALLGVGMRF